MLATSYLDGAQPPPEAIAAMQRAVAAFPNRLELAYNLVVLHLRLHQVDEARRVVEERLRGSQRDDLVEQARVAIQRVDLVDRSNAAVGEQDYAQAVLLLRQALDVTTDPVTVQRLTLQVSQLEYVVERNRHSELFNRAVGMLNRGQKAEARKLLVELEPKVRDLNLRSRIQAMLEGLEASP